MKTNDINRYDGGRIHTLCPSIEVPESETEERCIRRFCSCEIRPSILHQIIFFLSSVFQNVAFHRRGISADARYADCPRTHMIFE